MLKDCPPPSGTTVSAPPAATTCAKAREAGTGQPWSDTIYHFDQDDVGRSLDASFCSGIPAAMRDARDLSVAGAWRSTDPRLNGCTRSNSDALADGRRGRSSWPLAERDVENVDRQLAAAGDRSGRGFRRPAGGFPRETLYALAGIGPESRNRASVVAGDSQRREVHALAGDQRG